MDSVEELGVIFDMDGVLIDSYEAHFSAWQRMLLNHGMTMSRELFSNTFGQTNTEIFSTRYPNIDPAVYRRLSDEKEAAYRGIISANFPVMDGAAELVADLKFAGITLAIGSSGPPENVCAVLNVFPGGQYFKATTDASDVTRSKPDPEVFLKAAAKINIPVQKCVVVEDAPAGVRAGIAAGCAVVAVTGTTSREFLDEADLVVDSLRELTPEIFKDLVRSHRKTER